MTYTEFLNSLSGAFDLFLTTISAWVNNLMTNYFFITILGVGLFISFVLFIVTNFITFNISTRREQDKDNLYN